MRRRTIPAVFDALLAQHGPQGWWPAEDRFEIMAGAVLVQRTAWRNAAQAIQRLKARGALAAEQLAAVDSTFLETMIKPAGFFRVKAARLKALARFVVASGGVDALSRQATPSLRTTLLSQQGIGPETADAILGYAFERPVFVVDAYARRLFERLGSPDPLPSDFDLKADCEAEISTATNLNELHALIVAHSQRCCAAVPDCARCSLRLRCGYAAAAARCSA
jgi:endonuclease-3 related protein